MKGSKRGENMKKNSDTKRNESGALENHSIVNKRKRIRVAWTPVLAVICLVVGISVFGLWMIRDGSDSPDDDVTDRLLAEASDHAAEPSGDTLSAPDETPVLTETSVISTESTVPAFSAEDRAALLAELESDIESLLSEQSGRYAVYYINLENGETIAYQATDPMTPASTIKVPFNTYLYMKVAEGAFSMDDIMTYNSAAYPDGDYQSGSGTVQYSSNGTEYTLAELTRLSIRVSDNTATHMILRQYGDYDVVNTEYMLPVSAVVDYQSTVTYTDYTGQERSKNHRTSAQDIALYMAELYRLYMESPEDYRGLIDDLCNTDYTWGISEGVPDDITVAHKVGFLYEYGVYNDVAIVFGKEDYVLCVLTESGDESKAKANIVEVSGMVQAYLDQCYVEG
jgi:beta-lactamase class A